MQIPLVDALAANDGAIANVEQVLDAQRREEALIAALVAALDARDTARVERLTQPLRAAA